MNNETALEELIDISDQLQNDAWASAPVKTIAQMVGVLTSIVKMQQLEIDYLRKVSTVIGKCSIDV